MIVVCPECKTNYTIPDEILAGDDCSMKCNKCSHQWLEMGKREISNYDDVDHEEESSFEDALEQIEKTLNEEDEGEDSQVEEAEPETKPETEIDLVARDSEEVKEPEKKKAKKKSKESAKRKTKRKGGNLAGAFTALIAFIILFIASVMLRYPIMEHVPMSKALYATMGFDIPVDGEGLVFDRIKTTWNGSSLTVKGNIINLLPVDYVIPKIELIFQSEDNTTLDKVIFSVSDKNIKGEDMVPFKYEIQAMTDIKYQTRNIKLSFISPESN